MSPFPHKHSAYPWGHVDGPLSLLLLNIWQLAKYWVILLHFEGTGGSPCTANFVKLYQQHLPALPASLVQVKSPHKSVLLQSFWTRHWARQSLASLAVKLTSNRCGQGQADPTWLAYLRGELTQTQPPCDSRT